MFDFFGGLGGLEVILGLKVIDSLAAEERVQYIQNRESVCRNFYLKFVDRELESKLIEECKSEENITKFNLACREIGISSNHENIIDFHRIVVLLACQNKLPTSWFTGWTRCEPDLNWYRYFDGFNFIWNDPNDVYATTKLLCWINKMIHLNGSNVRLLVFKEPRNAYGSGYNYNYIDNCDRRDSIVNYVNKKKYMWDCALDPTDRILTK